MDCYICEESKTKSMNQEVAGLAPEGIWKNFELLNEVPRPSKKEEKVIQFMLDFGNSLGLETIRDEAGNVLIKKPATPGMENRKTVVLQSHLDMVHQKNSDKVFDFDKDGIQSLIDDEWVTADGTTLGADNGMAVAATMAVLESTNIQHPAIEALFTIDEETGMTGAFALQPGWLKGEILLNMDYEDEGELCIGCAGGIDTNVKIPISRSAADSGEVGLKFSLTGLKGGHSGVEIHLQRGNSNKILFSLINHLGKEFGFKLSAFDGGSLRNAIPREAFAEGYLASNKLGKVKAFVDEFYATIKGELAKTDPNVKLSIEGAELTENPLDADSQMRLVNAVCAFPNGVYKWSNDFENLVETSTNIARVKSESNEVLIQCLTRSSLESGKMDLAESLQALFELAGGKVEHKGSYPGWNPNPKSEILELARNKYNDLFGKLPEVKAIHAGLECGIIMSSQTQLDSVSFGPTIRNPHSPDEMVNIETVQKFWKYLLALLEGTPEK